MVNVRRKILAYLVWLCFLPLSLSQILEWAPCAVCQDSLHFRHEHTDAIQADCIVQLTNQSSSCQDGFRCFCTDDQLYNNALDCWSDNCSVKDALGKLSTATPAFTILTGTVSQNITVLECGFPNRNRGTVGTVVTFTSMGIALLFVGMHVMAFNITRVWGWGDLVIWFVTVSCIALLLCHPYSYPAVAHDRQCHMQSFW
jgi:hypothetical protein